MSKIFKSLLYLKGELFPRELSEVEKEKVRLQNLPRFTQTTTHLLGNILQLPDAASFLFMYDEIFHKESYKFRSFKEDILIIDCGANIGLSIIYFKKLFPEATVIGFEPDEKIFEALEHNIRSFDLPNVRLFKKACWSKETTLQFYSEGADAGRTATSFDKENVVSVETVRIKDFLDKEIAFLKIDIEGAEFEVLEDAAENLTNVKNIFIEYHSFVGQEQKLPEILSILKDAGFRLHISAPGLVSPNPFNSINQYAGMDNQLNIYGFR